MRFGGPPLTGLMRHSHRISVTEPPAHREVVQARRVCALRCRSSEMACGTIPASMRRLFATVTLVASLCAPTFAQPQTGELRLLIRDPTGSAVRASGVVSSDITHVERRFTTDD